jgi:hypothetical protein
VVIVVWILVLIMAAESSPAPFAGATTERLQALLRGAWWERTPDEVRSIWKEAMEASTCLPPELHDTDCQILVTERRECFFDEFLFAGREERLSFRGFSVTACVNDRVEAEGLLGQWRPLVQPAKDKGARCSDTSDEFHPVRSECRWGDGDRALILEARPEAGVWVVKMHLHRRAR